MAPMHDEFVQLLKESPRRDICTTLLDVSFSSLVRPPTGTAAPCHDLRELAEILGGGRGSKGCCGGMAGVACVVGA